jgi:hypothetical protein
VILDPTGPVARRFPLVARPRPACTPLPHQVADLCHRAADAAHHQDTAAATAVFNLAALLASDCALPDLARQWSHRLARAALLSDPQVGQQATHSLEPIVNLARLRTRAGDGIGAWSLLEDLYDAIASRTDTTIDGIDIPAARLTSTPQAHRELRAWGWATLLSSGARALAAAGRWDDAKRRLHEHNGIGHRMLDGRQIAVLAYTTAGNHDAALAMLRDTQPGKPWETAVTACLTLLCQRHTSPDRTDPWAAYRELDPSAPGLAVFHTRLGLSMIESLDGVNQSAAQAIASLLLSHATTDGYAARDVLAHHGCRSTATDPQLSRLAGLVDTCGLDGGFIPDRLVTDLSAALDTAEHVISPTAARTTEGPQ